MQNLQTEIHNIEISNPNAGNINKESHYHTSHTDFMYQRNITNNDNRKHSASKPLFHISTTI